MSNAKKRSAEQLEIERKEREAADKRINAIIRAEREQAERERAQNRLNAIEKANRERERKKRATLGSERSAVVTPELSEHSKLMKGVALQPRKFTEEEEWEKPLSEVLKNEKEARSLGPIDNPATYQTITETLSKPGFNATQKFGDKHTELARSIEKKGGNRKTKKRVSHTHHRKRTTRTTRTTRRRTVTKKHRRKSKRTKSNNRRTRKR